MNVAISFFGDDSSGLVELWSGHSCPPPCVCCSWHLARRSPPSSFMRFSRFCRTHCLTARVRFAGSLCDRYERELHAEWREDPRYAALCIHCLASGACSRLYYFRHYVGI